MSIPPRFLDELRGRLTLSEIIGRRIALKRAGREYSACCPFHGEKTPSFTVNDDKQFYHCFGCGAHGDVIGFVMQYDNLSFPDAVEMLAAEAGMQVPKQSPEEIKKAKQAKDLYALVEDAAKFFEEQLRHSANKNALDYMTGRGVNEESLSAFRIGYAPADGQALRKYLLVRDYTDAQMIEAGVTRASERGGEPYAFFRERIMFPVPDRRGRVVAFGGRILPDHLRPPQQGDFKPPKYINSSDTPLFHKGHMLYGEPHARQAASDGEPLVVVEGYLDVMACVQAGFKGALAPLGTALTEEQILALWKMIPDRERVPFLCFDGDNAGRRAAARACERILPLLKPDQSVRIAFLPEGEDPDTLIRGGGKKAFAGVLESAMPLVDFLWLYHTAGKSFSTPESRAGLEQVLEQDTLRIADRQVQQYYRDAFRQKVRTAFFPRYSKDRRPANQDSLSAPPLRRPAHSGNLLPFRVLLATLLNHPALFAFVEDELCQMDIPDEGLNRLRQAVLSALSGDSALDSEALCRHLNEVGYEVELNNVLSESVYTHAGFARPGSEEQDAHDGWTETIAIMQKKGVWRELKLAAQALAADFSEENEGRLLALRGEGTESNP